MVQDRDGGTEGARAQPVRWGCRFDPQAGVISTRTRVGALSRGSRQVKGCAARSGRHEARRQGTGQGVLPEFLDRRAVLPGRTNPPCGTRAAKMYPSRRASDARNVIKSRTCSSAGTEPNRPHRPLRRVAPAFRGHTHRCALHILRPHCPPPQRPPCACDQRIPPSRCRLPFNVSTSEHADRQACFPPPTRPPAPSTNLMDPRAGKPLLASSQTPLHPCSANPVAPHTVQLLDLMPRSVDDRALPPPTPPP